MTTAIPWIFPPVNFNDKLYVDGGCIDNYPISYFKNLDTVLGFCLVDNHDINDKIINIEQFTIKVVQSILSHKNYISGNTIKIFTNSFNSIDFSMSLDNKHILFNSGYSQTLQQL